MPGQAALTQQPHTTTPYPSSGTPYNTYNILGDVELLCKDFLPLLRE
jgi:hypothetical protein